MKVIRLLFMSLFFIGCGVEENYITDFDYIDNRERADFSNVYGYYGNDVIFGEEYIVGEWVLYHTQSNSRLFTRFYADGEMVMGNASRYLYGLSSDGLSIDISTGERINIISSHIYRELNGRPCYRVEILDYNDFSKADMCPR